VLLEYLVQKTQPRECLALAVLAFHRWIKCETSARQAEAAPNMPENREASKSLRDLAAVMKAKMENALQEALLADPASREKHAASENSFKNLAAWALAAPPPK
jgi:hypothetical protein